MISDDFENTLNPNGRVEVTILPSSLEMIQLFYDRAIKEGSEVVVKLEKQFWVIIIADLMIHLELVGN